MQAANFYGFAIGNENKKICRHINDDVKSIAWYINTYDKSALTEIIQTADLVIVVSDLDEYSQASEVKLILDLAQTLNVPVLIYAIDKMKLAFQHSQQAKSSTQLSSFEKTAIIIPIDEHTLINTPIMIEYFMPHRLDKDYSVLSINLIIALKALVEPITSSHWPVKVIIKQVYTLQRI